MLADVRERDARAVAAAPQVPLRDAKCLADGLEVGYPGRRRLLREVDPARRELGRALARLRQGIDVERFRGVGGGLERRSVERRAAAGAALEIAGGLKKVKWIAASTGWLVPVGKEQVEASFWSIFNPEVLTVTERSPRVYRGGIPFMIEVGIAYGGGLVSAGKKGEVMRFANRVPLLFDSGGCAITETIKSIDWRRYDVKDFDEEPLAVLVNLASVHVPYTSAGKQAVSIEEDIMDEIRFAVMEASRGVQKYLLGEKEGP